MIAAGIDFGITNSKIGIIKNGKKIIVPNSMGETCIPSVVAILDGNEIVGEEIMLHKTNDKNTITEIKRLIGKNINDLKNLKDIHYNIASNNGKLEIKINNNGKEEFYTPEKIISLIFKKLIKNASEFSGTTINNAVITVPNDFNDSQIDTIKEAAKLEDINILEIIKEPIAAALAYDFGIIKNVNDSFFPNFIKNKNDINNKKVLVFDFGGGSLDISVLEIEMNNISIKASSSDNIGGNDFDNKLIDYCLHDFCQKSDIDEKEVRKDFEALKRLKTQCEKVKKKLMNNESLTISFYNFFNNFNLYVEVNKERFNEMCEDLYQKIENMLDKVLTDSSYTSDQIDNVIIAGGSSKIPRIKEILTNKFNEDKIKDNLNAEEVNTIGASLRAEKLAKKLPNQKLKTFEFLPFSLGVGVVSKNEEEIKIGQIMSFLIKKNSKLPIDSEKRRYKTIKDDQSFFKIKIFYGDNKYIKDNRPLGTFILDNLPKGKAKTVAFKMFLSADVNGKITLNAEVENTGAKLSGDVWLKDVNTDNTEEDTNNKPTTIIRIQKNPESNKKLDEIRKNVKNINEKNDALEKITNDEEKINCLKELYIACLNIINIYETLKKDKDSEYLNEKIFDYTKLLFQYYSQIIIIDKDEKYTSEIINKIIEEIPKFINDNIENLLTSLSKLKENTPRKYCEIILFCVEILYKEGDKILEERKPYARYYSRKFYQKAENIKKYINEILKDIGPKNEQKLREIEKNYGSKISQIDAFVKAVKNEISQKDTQFFPKKSGFTFIGQALNKKEDIHFVIDIYQEMADSFSKGKTTTEEEAFIKANIIKINFKIFKNYDFNLYSSLNKRIEYIYERLDIDDDEEPEWHKKLEELNKEIEMKRIEIENQKKIDEETSIKSINEINNVFKEKVERDKNPMEFLEFIIENYPYINFDPSKKEELMQDSFENIFKNIFPRYHSDNYKESNKFKIYTEIYTLLVKIEESFIKNKL